MLRKRFIDLSNHFTSSGIDDPLAVPVVQPVDFSEEMVPLRRVAVKIIATDRLMDGLRVARPPPLETELLIKVTGNGVVDMQIVGSSD